MSSSPLSLFQSLDLWKEKCSICFERRCDFCLPGCDDQFCLPCMKRYLQEVVDSSWGLSGCHIRCPVCREDLPKSVWTRYADRKTTQKFEAFTQPYRLLSRFCSECGGEVAVAQPPPLKPENQRRCMDRILALINNLARGDEARELQEQITKALSTKKKNITQLYLTLGPKIWALASKIQGSKRGSLARRKELQVLAVKILTAIISLEGDPEKWRQLQYHHLKFLPKLICDHCSAEMCFRCGEPDWHEELSCQAHLSSRLQTCREDLSETIRWALLNGKRCPNCSVLIHREDGCNKIDCLYCGHMFCWVCEETWSVSCGFYRCGTQDTLGYLRPSQGPSVQTQEAGSQRRRRPQPELGVPDVNRIERKLAQKEGEGAGGSSPLFTAISLILVILSLAFLVISLLNACLLFKLFDQQDPPRSSRMVPSTPATRPSPQS